MSGHCPFASRRGLLAAAASLAAAKTVPARAQAAGIAPNAGEPFYGEHQGGILTPQQRHSYFAALDLTTRKVADIPLLLRRWTYAAARMTAGEPAEPLSSDAAQPPGDSGDVLGLPPSSLTITFGFGPGLFIKDNIDRYGLARYRPDALTDLPLFNGDQLVEAHTGGDLSVQACADDAQVAFHAVRQLVRLAYGAAQIRWVQTGFLPDYPAEETPRNLMGFKDGTMNPGPPHRSVFVSNEGLPWMRNGSYLVARRIRISLEHWDRTGGSTPALR
jgi:deferrochelatase/peroxidase EfeB